jgi:hypothetical protein
MRSIVIKGAERHEDQAGIDCGHRRMGETSARRDPVYLYRSAGIRRVFISLPV